MFWHSRTSSDSPWSHARQAAATSGWCGTGWAATWWRLPGFVELLGTLEEDLARIGRVDYRAPSSALVALDEMTVADWIEARVDGGRRSELGQVLEMSTCLGLGRSAPELSAVSLIHLWLGLPDLDDTGEAFRFGQNMDETRTRARTRASKTPWSRRSWTPSMSPVVTT